MHAGLIGKQQLTQQSCCDSVSLLLILKLQKIYKTANIECLGCDLIKIDLRKCIIDKKANLTTDVLAPSKQVKT